MAQKQKYRSMEQDRKSKDKPMHLQSPKTKEVRIYNGEKTIFSASSIGKHGQLHVNQCEVRTHPHTIHKDKLEMA